MSNYWNGMDRLEKSSIKGKNKFDGYIVYEAPSPVNWYISNIETY